MRHAEIFAGGQQIFHAPWNQRAQRNLKRQRAAIRAVVARRGDVEIHPVAPDAHAVGELGRAHRFLRQPGFLHARLGRDVLLQHGELRLDAAALADVRIFRQPVRRADDIGPQPQTFPARVAVRARRFGLQPVNERQAQLLRALKLLFSFGVAHIADQAEGIIILRPVHERQVAAIKSRHE